MSSMNRSSALKCGLAATVMLVAVVVGVVLYITQAVPGPQRVNARELDNGGDEAPATNSSVAMVEVAHPRKGMDLTLEQPGSVHAYETVQLQANVSGFLAMQTVDIGDRVKRGKKLAVIALPEIEKQKQRNEASIEQAKARVKQMQARVTSAEADRDATRAAVEQADAAYKSASAWVRFRGKQYDRMKELFKLTSIEERLVDESKERYEASVETERAAKAAIATSKAHLIAATAKIKQAEADVVGARSEIKVARADLDKTQVLLDYAVIAAPFDGEICRRNFFPGDFIRAATEGSARPLLTIQRTDKLRVVVQVPDTAVPYLDKGDPAIVRIDSLPGKKFPGVVSRKTGSEDPNTRLMRVEIDVNNPTGEIGDGMYGKVVIMLDRFPNLCSVPTASIVKMAHGKSAVWVVRDKHAHRTEVKLSKDNGTRVVLLSGVKTGDLIVLHPPESLSDGCAVETRVVESAALKTEE